MKRMLAASVVAMMFGATPAWTAARHDHGLPYEFSGTWKAEIGSIRTTEKPAVYILRDGTYSCASCVLPLRVKADGAFHPVEHQPYFDNMSVTVVDNRTVKTVQRKAERVITETGMTVSSDGASFAYRTSDSTVPNAPPVVIKGTATRIRAAPPGAHMISGSWKIAGYRSISDEGLVFTFDSRGTNFHMSGRSGVSYDARIDGPDVPIKGDPGGTRISVRLIPPNHLRETSRRNGKVINITTYTVANKRMRVVSENTLQGSTMTYTAKMQ